jgi:uncharacterized membrane protein
MTERFSRAAASSRGELSRRRRADVTRALGVRLLAAQCALRSDLTDWFRRSVVSGWRYERCIRDEPDRSIMSEPVLSPRSPLSLLASSYPAAGAMSAVMLLILGGWLMVSPAAFAYTQHPQAAHDMICGAIVILLGLVSLAARRPWVEWIAGCLGLWLFLAPVVLWSPSLGAYLNVTLVGLLIAMEGIVVPLSERLPGGEFPAGWSYDPSARSERLPTIVLAGLAFFVAVYLAAFQLGYIARIWDPVFGAGTAQVLGSDISRAWPVSDAALGATAYLFDLVLASVGDERRWRTMPWLVLLYGLMIVPVGVVSIVLVILQPVAVGAWCGWCLVTAAASLAMIPFALDEVAATLQLLRQVHRAGRSWWRVLWRGEDDAAALPVSSESWKTRPPLSLVMMAGAGLWMMLEPSALRTTGATATSAHVAGALAIVIAVVAMSEVARAVRLAAVPLAVWIGVAPWLLAGSTPTSHFTGLVIGFVILASSMPRGTIAEHRSTLDRLARWPSSWRTPA